MLFNYLGPIVLSFLSVLIHLKSQKLLTKLQTTLNIFNFYEYLSTRILALALEKIITSCNKISKSYLLFCPYLQEFLQLYFQGEICQKISAYWDVDEVSVLN